MTNFSIKWGTEVKELARKCVNNEFISLVAKGENGTLTESEEIKVKELSEGIKDAYGMWYMSNMIWRVEHALADDREHLAILAVAEIHSTISSESYWTNVWNNDFSTEEAVNIRNLRDGLKELLRC